MLSLEFLEAHMISSIVLGMGLGLIVLEIIIFSLGGSLSSLSEVLSFDNDIETNNFGVLSWVNQGNIPTGILLTLSLIYTGSISLFLSYILNSHIPDIITLTFSFFIMLYPLKYTTVILNKILPGEHTVAVSKVTFIGKVVNVSGGDASKELMSEAIVIDDYGNEHYIYIIPEEGIIEQNSKALLLEFKEKENIFIATKDLNRIIEED